MEHQKQQTRQSTKTVKTKVFLNIQIMYTTQNYAPAKMIICGRLVPFLVY